MRDPNFEDRLRKAFEALPRPSDDVTRTAMRRALSAVDDGSTRRTRSRGARRGLSLVAAVLMTFGALAGFALGRTSAPDRPARTIAKPLTATGGPGFIPTRGWNTLQTDGAAIGPGGMASAATVSILEPPRAFPHETIASLGPDDVLIRASLYGRADFIRPGWAATYPMRTLPVKTPHGEVQTNWEGGSGWRYVITGRVQGWLLEATVYFGAEPTAATRRIADAELARLLLPSPCPVAQPISADELDRASAATKRLIPRYIDTSVSPTVDYRGPIIVARRAASGDAVPSGCREVPLERIVVVDVRYPALKLRPALEHRTYLVSRQAGRDVVWARTR